VWGTGVTQSSRIDRLRRRGTCTGSCAVKLGSGQVRRDQEARGNAFRQARRGNYGVLQPVLRPRRRRRQRLAPFQNQGFENRGPSNHQICREKDVEGHFTRPLDRDSHSRSDGVERCDSAETVFWMAAHNAVLGCGQYIPSGAYFLYRDIVPGESQGAENRVAVQKRRETFAGRIGQHSPQTVVVESEPGGFEQQFHERGIVACRIPKSLEEQVDPLHPGAPDFRCGSRSCRHTACCFECGPERLFLPVGSGDQPFFDGGGRRRRVASMDALRVGHVVLQVSGPVRIRRIHRTQCIIGGVSRSCNSRPRVPQSPAVLQDARGRVFGSNRHHRRQGPKPKHRSG